EHRRGSRVRAKLDEERSAVPRLRPEGDRGGVGALGHGLQLDHVEAVGVVEPQAEGVPAGRGPGTGLGHAAATASADGLPPSRTTTVLTAMLIATAASRAT